MVDLLDKAVTEASSGHSTNTAYWAYKELAEGLAEKVEDTVVRRIVIEQIISETQEVWVNFEDIDDDVREKLGVPCIKKMEPTQELVELWMDDASTEVVLGVLGIEGDVRPVLSPVRVQLK